MHLRNEHIKMSKAKKGLTYQMIPSEWLCVHDKLPGSLKTFKGTFYSSKRRLLWKWNVIVTPRYKVATKLHHHGQTICVRCLSPVLTLVRDECATSYHPYLTFATSWRKYDANEVHKNIRLSTLATYFTVAWIPKLLHPEMVKMGKSHESLHNDYWSHTNQF